MQNAPLLTEGGFAFRDLNKNGVLDPYEDSRRSIDERVADLLGRMTLEEKAGMLFHTMIGMNKDGSLVEGESFFGRMKCEVASGELFATRDQARAELFEYLEVFYNRVRRHSSLGYLSPVEFERTYNQNHP